MFTDGSKSEEGVEYAFINIVELHDALIHVAQN